MIYLIRHAECQGNISQRFVGVTESLLTSRGKAQLLYLKNKFQTLKFDQVIASPIQRAAQTAQVLNTVSLKYWDALKEMNGGLWENKPIEELKRTSPDYLEFQKNIDRGFASEGESVEDIRNRLLPVVDYLSRAEGNIAIVSHGITLRILESLLIHSSIKDRAWLENTAYSIFLRKGGRFILKEENVCTHLPEEMQLLSHDKWWARHDAESSQG